MPAEWFERHKLPLFGILLVTIIGLQIAQLATGPADPPAYTSTPEQEAALPRKVYVSGAVKEPGVYEFRQGDRVEQALELAGGAAANADLDQINLAVLLVDEQQVHVPEQGGVSGESAKIDLNRAELDEITTLDGIGPVSAEKLIAYRRLNGPFRSLDDLLAAGLNRSQVEKIKDHVLFR
ncbi:MAG: ComEA family DNA-binding protein [Chloroflexi bacterium]|nr:ComEA family DNA-binding protein [Chloroflexota bacterium]